VGRGLRIVIATLAAAAAVAVLGAPFYAFPAHDEPREVDAVYVIGPPTGPRIELAERMIADGLADELVISLAEWPQERERWTAAAAACDAPRDYPVHCEQPDPFTTRGEARWMRELIDQEGWDSVAVITVTPHLTRTRVIMERCWDGDLSYLDSGESLAPWVWAYQYLYQTLAFVKVWMEDGC